MVLHTYVLYTYYVHLHVYVYVFVRAYTCVCRGGGRDRIRFTHLLKKIIVSEISLHSITYPMHFIIKIKNTYF